MNLTVKANDKVEKRDIEKNFEMDFKTTSDNGSDIDQADYVLNSIDGVSSQSQNLRTIGNAWPFP